MNPDSRYAHVDSLRAIAALLVVWMHTSVAFAPLAGGAWLHDIAERYNFGRAGVVAFFGVSGFLIPNSLRAGREQPGRTFAIRRFFRLFPAFWLSIPLGVATLWILQDKTISALDVALNATMLPDLFRAPPVMSLYWTLEYELAFYAACLLLFKAGVLHRRYTAAVATALFLAGYMAGFAGLVVLNQQPLADMGVMSLNMGCLFLGALWRRALERRLDVWEKLLLAGALAAFFLITPAACAYAVLVKGSANPFYVQFPASYAAGVGIFLLMTSAVKISWRPLAWVGLISYSLYLLHPVAIYLMRYHFDHGGAGGSLPTGLLMLIAAVFAIALAAGAYYLVERPAIRLGQRLTRDA